jgi:N-acetylmuramic acid 6-phosphate (MurNAc-6-P) etherase
VSPRDAQRLLAAAGGRAKLAIVMARLGVDRREAARRLAAAHEFLGRALTRKAGGTSGRNLAFRPTRAHGREPV